MTTTCKNVQTNAGARKPKSRKIVDLTGKEFPLFRVIYYTGRKYRNSPLWLCACICGRFFEATTNKIRGGKTLSCGCYRKALFTPNSPVSWFQEGTNLHAFGRLSKTNKSGVPGVRYIEERDRWEARLNFKGKLVLNKSCHTFEEAVARRREAEEEYVIPLLDKYRVQRDGSFGQVV